MTWNGQEEISLCSSRKNENRNQRVRGERMRLSIESFGQACCACAPCLLLCPLCNSILAFLQGLEDGDPAFKIVSSESSWYLLKTENVLSSQLNVAELAASNGKGIVFIIIKGCSVRFGSARHTHIDVDRISCFEILSLLGQRIAATAGRSCCRSICLEIKFDMQTFSHIFPPFRLVESCERISILVTFDSNSSCRR